MKKTDNGSAIPGAVAAQIARGVPQHKAIASVGLDTKPAREVKR